ncbi:MAG: hypothetical protein ABWY06_03040 [Pseudomonas sp.]|uniref:hypothetical protein n=1 Tax=Pseudomonas sp. TaxID=306 RepID=UPI0033999CFF
MRTRLWAALWILLVLAGTELDAAEPLDSFARLHQVRLAIHGSLTDLYLLYEDPHSSSAALEQRLADATDTIDTLQGLRGTPAQRPWAQLQTRWRPYREQLSELGQQQRAQDAPDLRALSELLSLNRALLTLCDQLEHRLRQQAAKPPGELINRSRAAGLVLQQIASAYAAHSLGANLLGAADQAPDQLAADFAEQLVHLQVDTPAQQRTLDDIWRKWRFIEGALMHYQGVKVPFVIQQYSSSMIAALERLGAQGP